MYIVEIALCIFICLLLSMFVREIVHVLIAKLSGLIITSMGVGTGKPILMFNFGNMRIFICIWNVLNGLTFAYSPYKNVSSYSRKIYFYLGLLSNVLLFLIGLSMYMYLSTFIIVGYILSIVNLFILFWNIIPMRFPNNNSWLYNDAAYLSYYGNKNYYYRRLYTIYNLNFYIKRCEFKKTISDYHGLYYDLIYTGIAYLNYGDIHNADRI